MALNALPPRAEKHARVRAMFDRIAPRYDRLNRLLTGGLDQRWRRRAVAAVGIGSDDRVLDLACGTGDLAELCAARGARVLGVDFAGAMLRGARSRGIPAVLVQGDAARLPVRDGWASAVVSGFALRNFVSLPEVFAELARVVAPGGRIALLDVDRPRSRWLRPLHALWFDRAVPRIGGLLSDRAAYAYLPQSTSYLPPASELVASLERAGFAGARHETLLFGTVQLLTAVRKDGR